jgi:ppGpp synthetase/RelA/SpoT-type nucleotidyltranferase
VPSLPVSKKQIDKLGDRLRDADAPAEADLVLLQEVLTAYDDALQLVRSNLVEIGVEPTVRLKTTGTLVDKLRRNRSSSLKTVHDLAGARLVIDGGIPEQDAATARVVSMCVARGYRSEVVDRRSDPREGYRAVHVICWVDGISVEIQIRSELQDLWAQIFERLADAWGRGLRYGDGLTQTGINSDTYERRAHIVRLMHDLSEDVAQVENDKSAYSTWPPEIPPATDDPPVDDRERMMRDLNESSRRAAASIQRYEETVRLVLDELGRLIDEEVKNR